MAQRKFDKIYMGPSPQGLIIWALADDGTLWEFNGPRVGWRNVRSLPDTVDDNKASFVLDAKALGAREA